MTGADLYNFFYGSESVNHKILMFINHGNSPVLDAVMPVATFLGGSNLFPAYFLILVALFMINRRIMPGRFLLVFFLAALLSFGMEAFLKDFFHVPRPPFALDGENVRVLGRIKRTFALPSGHAVFSFMAASALSYGRGRWCRFLLFLGAFLVAYSRVYMGHHYPLDVVIGAVVGIGCSLAAWKFCGFIEGRYDRRRGKS